MGRPCSARARIPFLRRGSAKHGRPARSAALRPSPSSSQYLARRRRRRLLGPRAPPAESQPGGALIHPRVAMATLPPRASPRRRPPPGGRAGGGREPRARRPREGPLYIRPADGRPRFFRPEDGADQVLIKPADSNLPRPLPPAFPGPPRTETRIRGRVRDQTLFMI